MTAAPTPVHEGRQRRLALVVPYRIALAVALVLTAAAVVLLVRHDRAADAGRPDLQRQLDALVTGPDRLAPGAVAYVSGPRGTWVGAAGLADVARSRPMTTDARMRLESVSKIYTALIVHQLAEDGRLTLDDTLEQWLPGMFPYGSRVTLTHLLTHTSGIVDDNVVVDRPSYYLSLIHEPGLRAELVEFARRWRADPALEFSAQVWVKIAAAVPLLFEPGAEYHYSNTGFVLLGMVASRAAGKSIQELYRERIFEPLGLKHTAWDPQGPITGEHARGYALGPHGRLHDRTDWHGGKDADGAVVSNVTETAAVLQGIMNGRLLGGAERAAMKAVFWSGGSTSACAGAAYGHSGAGDAFKTNVWVSGDGSRVAVLLLNGRGDAVTDIRAGDAMTELYCAA